MDNNHDGKSGSNSSGIYSDIFTGIGSFFTGCNYWASHAGTAMWSDWKADVVESDFAKLAEAGLKVLRIFPLWPDFQPIKLLRGYSGKPVEYCYTDESPLTDDEEGKAGISRKAIAEFEEFASLARKYSLKLIVGLVTGWMSGRLFVPPALEGRNVIRDPLALMWEARFVRYFVRHFKDEPSIIAWDLGNECNCMGEVASSEEAWNWVSCITCAIKSEDNVKPVISGMHSLKTEGSWTIADQAEIVDILTTHPYPSPTYNTHQDPMNTMRIGFHSSSQSLMYRGIGGKPCFAEEVGTFGPMFSSEKIAADFVRSNLFTLWAHDCRGFLWWCANEQSHLKHAPYDWSAVERELGLFRTDGTPKPVLGEISRFTDFIGRFNAEYGNLPPRITDGICLLTRGQGGDGAWAAGYSAFVLAKQAGMDIEYRQDNQQLPDAPLYIMPSVRGWNNISRRRLEILLAKVYAGAALYISVDDAIFSPFEEFSGVEVQTREKCSETDIISIIDPEHQEGKTTLDIRGTFKYRSRLTRAEMLGADSLGNPVYTVAGYGKGKVYFLSYPLETYLFNRPGAFHREEAKPYWKIYRYLKEGLDTGRLVSAADPFTGVTEHVMQNGDRVVIAINYKPEARRISVNIADGWKPGRTIYGSRFRPDGGINSFASGDEGVRENDAAVFTIIKGR